MTTVSEATSVVGYGAETTAVSGGVKTCDVDLPWSVVDAAPDSVRGDGRRQLPKARLAFFAAIAAIAVVALGAFVFGGREPAHVNTLAMQLTSAALFPTTAAVRSSHEVPVPVIVPAAKRAPVVPNAAPEPGSPVAIEVSPPAATAIPPAPPAPSPRFDPAGDQWLLDNLRSLGYTIINPSRVVSSAYQACRLFQEGESPEQVNQQMSVMTGLNIDDTLQLTSSAMLAYYPNCA